VVACQSACVLCALPLSVRLCPTAFSFANLPAGLFRPSFCFVLLSLQLLTCLRGISSRYCSSSVSLSLSLFRSLRLSTAGAVERHGPIYLNVALVTFAAIPSAPAAGDISLRRRPPGGSGGGGIGGGVARGRHRVRLPWWSSCTSAS
jgi:hypothetical protein